MTPRERARAIADPNPPGSITLRWQGHELAKAIEAAISAAVEVERKRCAKVAQNYGSGLEVGEIWIADRIAAAILTGGSDDG